MRYETLSDAPNGIKLEKVVRALLEDLSALRGTLITGRASALFSSDSHWGEPCYLPSGEMLFLRVHPEGLLSNRPLERAQTVLVAARRCWPDSCADSQVSVAVLWHPLRTAGVDLSSLARTTQSTVSTRYLNLLPLSIFSHHDAIFPTTGEQAYPILDDRNFHSVKPTTYTITTTKSDADGARKIMASPASGDSQWILAGAIGGADLPDETARTVELVTANQWTKRQEKLSKRLDKALGKNSMPALTSSLLLCDLLSIEGIASMLCLGFLDGALPDMLHSPAGVPLLIAASLRIACVPSLFGLPAWSQQDKAAATLFKSLFDSSWPPLPGGEMAIDRVLAAALVDARAGASADIACKAVSDHLVLFYRCGLHALHRVFGEDSVSAASAPPEPFGSAEKTRSSLLDAYRRKLVAGFAGGLPVAEEHEPLPSVLPGASRDTKQSTLLRVANSVEDWLRNGVYAGTTVIQENEQALEKAVKKGVDAAPVPEGDREKLEGGLRELLSANTSTDRLIELGHELGFVDPNTGMVLEEHVCTPAAASASSLLAAAMCQGGLVTHQLSMATFVAAPAAFNSCACCDKMIRLLPTKILGGEECAKCRRPLCPSCSLKPTVCKRCPKK